jgi:hypothetical protein
MTRHDREVAEQLKAVFYCIGFLFFSIFIINAFVVYKKYSRKYNFDEADYHVHDAYSFLQYIPISIGAAAVPAITLYMIYSWISGGNFTYTNIIIAIICFIFFALFPIISLFAISARMGTAQVGMLVYKNKGIFVIPKDSRNNSLLENIFSSKLIKDSYSMEEIPLDGLVKITRKSGKYAYVHGNFGTRCISWNDKQKRDECIAALEMACGRRLTNIDVGL